VSVANFVEGVLRAQAGNRIAAEIAGRPHVARAETVEDDGGIAPARQPRGPAPLVVPDAAAAVQNQHRREGAGAGGPPELGRGAAVGAAERLGVEAERFAAGGNRACCGEDAERGDNENRSSVHWLHPSSFGFIQSARGSPASWSGLD
jgi:hypothetical protein